MQYVGIGVGALLLAGFVVAGLVRLGLAVRGARPRGFWRRVLLVQLALLPVHALVVVPLALGFLGARFVGTRPDERGYAGPRFDADGRWTIQTRATLAAERSVAATAPNDHARTLTAADGVTLRAFFVPAPRPRSVAVILVHGLFRSALELEPPAAMCRDLGADVLLLELRNHGGSGRARPSFGRDEALDVVAAAGWLRGEPRTRSAQLVLFGVSLGTVAVALAAPRLEPLGGLVLDSPIEDLVATAHHMLSARAAGQPRRLGLWQPWRSLAITALELWAGTDLKAIRPLDALHGLQPLPALVIGGGLDDRAPPDAVRRCYEALPGTQKELWLLPNSGHGNAWQDAPEEYRAKLEALLQRIERH